MKRIFYLILLIGCSFGFLRFSRDINQIVKGKVFSNGVPVPFARVRIKTSDNYILTSKTGEFELSIPGSPDSLVITAWAEGYFNGATKISTHDTSITINLNKLYEKDNPDYVWIAPDKDPQNKSNCGNCHSGILMDQWGKNAHSYSAKNPYFLAIYYGKDTNLVRDCGIGYKKDFPNTNGNCATCHIPGAATNDSRGIDPLSVSDVNKNGVFCDICHKAKDVVLSGGQNVTGVLAMTFLRPPEGKKLFFGPYDDIREPDTYLPLIKKSEFCAPCHTLKLGDTEVYNSFNEWKNSPYPEKGIQCQTCHMAPDGVTTNFAPGKGGQERNPLSIPTHLHPGSRDQKILANALTMNFSVEQKHDSIKVMVSLYNNNAGHHIPTDSPSRNMILLINAVNEHGETLELLKGETVPSWGGNGSASKGNYGGLPGKGFAKVLKDSDGRAPAPDWRAAGILSDNRIAAFYTDKSYYYFKAPKESSQIKVKAKLIYRRFFKETMKEKGFALTDIIMKADSMNIKARAMK